MTTDIDHRDEAAGDTLMAQEERMTADDEIPNPKAFFVYGTLRDDLGHSRSSVVPDGAEAYDATVPASLYNLGSFPGARPSEDAVVAGRFYDMSALSDAEFIQLMRRWDRIEGHPTLFRRDLTEVEVEGRPEWTEAWIYYYASEPTSSARIESGNWADVVNIRRSHS